MYDLGVGWHRDVLHGLCLVHINNVWITVTHTTFLTKHDPTSPVGDGIKGSHINIEPLLPLTRYVVRLIKHCHLDVAIVGDRHDPIVHSSNTF